MLAVAFGLKLHWLKPIATIPRGASVVTQLHYLLLPALALAIVYFGYIARMMRAGAARAAGIALQAGHRHGIGEPIRPVVTARIAEADQQVEEAAFAPVRAPAILANPALQRVVVAHHANAVVTRQVCARDLIDAGTVVEEIRIHRSDRSVEGDPEAG